VRIVGNAAAVPGNLAVVAAEMAMATIRGIQTSAGAVKAEVGTEMEMEIEMEMGTTMDVVVNNGMKLRAVVIKTNVVVVVVVIAKEIHIIPAADVDAANNDKPTQSNVITLNCVTLYFFITSKTPFKNCKRTKTNWRSITNISISQ
jgi:hypothetical protein